MSGDEGEGEPEPGAGGFDFLACYGAVVDRAVAEEERDPRRESFAAAAAECPITIVVQTRKHKRVPLKQKFKPTDTLADLRRAIADEVEPDSKKRFYDTTTKPEPEPAADGSAFLSRFYHLRTEVEVAELSLVFNGAVMMNSTKKLEDFGMTSGIKIVTIVVRLKGGASLPLAAPSYSKPHIFKPKIFPEMSTTKAADDLLFIVHKMDPRVVAPCGKHAFTGETYYQLLKRMLTKDDYTSRLKCPMSGCGVEIPFDFLQKAAMLSPEENLFFSSELGMRGIKPLTRYCPGCDRICERPERLDQARVTCGRRGCRDFCFMCGELWKARGLQVCGNELCGTFQIQLMIRKAPMIKVSGGSRHPDGYECPSMRACPKCLTVIQWTAACKHFKCTGCGHYFCFLCLKKAKPEEGEVGCKITGAYSMCELADRQIIY